MAILERFAPLGGFKGSGAKRGVELNRFAMAFVITLWNVSMGSISASVQVHSIWSKFNTLYYIIRILDKSYREATLRRLMTRLAFGRSTQVCSSARP